MPVDIISPQSSATVESRAEVFEANVRHLALDVPTELTDQAQAYHAGVEKARAMVLDDIRQLWQTSINRSREPEALGGGTSQAEGVAEALRELGRLHESDIEKTNVPALQAQARGVSDSYGQVAQMLEDVIAGEFDGLLPPLNGDDELVSLLENQHSEVY